MSIIIEPVVSFVIERIANLLSEEIKFLVGVEDQVNGLLKELTWMQSYLKDAEAKQEEFNEVDRVTFREITKIAYDAEDVVESFILEPPTTIRRKEGFFKKYICICCSALYTHQVGIEVEAIKKRIKETEEMFQRYNVRRNTLEYRGQSSTSMVPQVRSSPYTSIDEHVVGLDEDITLQSTLTESRRLAIHLRVDHTLPTQDLHVRSLLVNHDSSLDLAQKTMMVKELAAAFKKYKFLRVLQLCNIQLANDEKALPEEIGQLIFLRYLEIRNSSIYEIPQSINNLCRLLTFDYGVDRGDAEIRIPSDVFNKMERLVCLRFPYRNPIRVLTTGASGTTSKIELNGLKSLQTLWGISSESFRGLEHLSCLKELKIIHVASTEEMSAMWQCPSIRMDRLCKLNLQWEDSVEAQSLEPISHCRHLTRLTLRGRLCMLSNLPYNLSKLNLYQSRLRQDSIPALGNLRHLRWLRMSDGAYEDAKMIIRGNAFPQLVELFLEDRINEILLGMLRLVIDAEVRITCEPNSSFPHMIIDGVISYIRTSDGQLRPIYKSHIQLDTSHAQFRLIYRMQ
ncbi:hypothetical protein Ancab_001164 [Ancistrocladus abbreviatus]